MDTKVTSACLTCRAVGPHMIQQGSGKIINVTTLEVFRANPII